MTGYQHTTPATTGGRGDERGETGEEAAGGGPPAVRAGGVDAEFTGVACSQPIASRTSSRWAGNGASPLKR